MREEYIKNHREVEGVTVYDLGNEYVFNAKNEKGEDVEHHITKKDQIKISDNAQSEDLETVLRASVKFPNMNLSEALKELKKMDKEVA